MTILCVRFQLPPTREAALPELLGLLEEFTPVVEALPPDGALADLRGAERYFGRDAVALASVIRVRALALHGVDCVIGAGPGPMLARMALRDARPGLTRAVPGGEERAFLDGKPVAALPGVGTATARTLCEYGLDTLGRVAAAPLSTLQRLVGARTGRELHEKAQGVDRGRVVPNGVSRSLAADRPFDRDELDPDRHRRALLSAAGDLGARLRAVDKVCRTLTLTVRYADRSATTRSRTWGADRALGGPDPDRLRPVRGARPPARPGPFDRPARGEPHVRRTRLPPAHLRPRGREGPPDRGGRGPRAGEVRAEGGDAGVAGGVRPPRVSWPTGE